MAKVVVAEKPSVAADIAKVLGASTQHETHWQGDDLIVTWAVGHLLELKTPEEYDEALKNWRSSIDKLPFIPEKFELKPIKVRGKNQKQLSAIKKLITAKTTTEVINACDAAREGELIFRRITEWAKIKCTSSRMWLQSLTSGAIQSAWDDRKSSAEFDDLRDAAVSRAEADWIIGMNGSRIATTSLPRTKRESGSISLGRVQTATLAIIADHEIEILSHCPDPFWELKIELAAGDANWSARWERKNHKEDIENPELKAHRIMELSEKEMLEKVINSSSEVQVEEKKRKSLEKAPLPFDLTALQREANGIWSWSAKKTLSLAQDLYDTYKLTTYPRTDSRHLTTDMRDSVDVTIKKLGAQESYSEHSNNLNSIGLVNTERIFDDSKVSDHFAIIPTGKIPDPDLGSEHSRLYDLVSRQFLSAFHPHAEWEVQKRVATKDGEEFSREVRKIVTPGWRAVRPKKDNVPEGWNELPNSSCVADMVSSEFTEEMTKPLNRLKEAKLLNLMEHAGRRIDDEELAEALKGKGLGTPATRAETIEKLISRGYIFRSRNGALRASALGIRIIDVLRQIPVVWITSPELTGEMESILGMVQKGQSSRGEYMNQIKEMVGEMIDKIRDHDRSTLYDKVPSIGDCPLCGLEIEETAMSYRCSANSGADKGCALIMWKDASGRWFDRTTATRLLQNGSISDLHGFFNQSGEQYTRNVEMKGGKVVVEGSAAAKSSSSDEEVAKCPVCKSGTVRISTEIYSCDEEECTFRGIKREMCKRPISKEEAHSILTTNKSPLIMDFISKRGKEFPAYLVLQNGRIKFEFPPREADPNAKKFEVVEGDVGLCKKTGVAVIETETHYRATENDKGCTINIAREISSRVISREEAKEIIEKGKVGPFEDLLSKKTGKPFSAILYLKANFQVGYRFAKR